MSMSSTVIDVDSVDHNRWCCQVTRYKMWGVEMVKDYNVLIIENKC